MHLHLSGLLSGLAAAWLALVIHEGGHVLAGMLVGCRFALFGVGPLCIARTGERLSVRWLPPSHWGPFGAALPRSGERLRARYSAVVAGGPLANLLVAALALASLPLLPHAAETFARWLALLSAAVFVATAQPFGSGSGIPSDGARVWGQIRNRPEARAEAALLALAGAAAAGVRPREWDPVLVERAAGMRTPAAFRLEAATLLLSRAMDAGDPDVARERVAEIRELLPGVPRWLRAEAAAEAAFWLAYFDRDPEAARALMRDARGALGDPRQRWRAEAAVRLRSGDPDGARRALGKAREALERGTGSASALDRELLAALGVEIESGGAAGSPPGVPDPVGAAGTAPVRIRPTGSESSSLDPRSLRG